MVDKSLEDQVYILQAQLNAATSRIAELEAMIGHRQEAHLGMEISRALLISAREILTGSQFNQLNKFLTSIRKLNTLNDPSLHESTSNLLRDFYIAEPALSLRPEEKLVRPGGSPSASIGLIMHCPSQNKSSNYFFDYENPSVKLLMDKGITKSNAYGFDWHWRAETHKKHRKCPIRGYSPQLESLHEVLTLELIKTLPLPLLIIAGSCAWKRYVKTLSAQAKHVKVPISPGAHCSFVLEYRSDQLKRISCHIPHPESLFYNKTLEWELDSIDLALILDCSLNLVLKLTGKASLATNSHFVDIVHANRKYKSKYLLTSSSLTIKHATSDALVSLTPSSLKNPRRSDQVCNGLTKCHAYVKEEEALGTHLTLSQYDHSFVVWALQAYGVIAHDVFKKGESLAVAVKQAMANKVNAKNRARRQLDKMVKAKMESKFADEKNLSLDIVCPGGSQGSKRLLPASDEVENDISIAAMMPFKKKPRAGPTSMKKPANREEHELWHSKIINLWASGDIYFWIPSEETRLRIRIGSKLGHKLRVKLMDNMDNPKPYTINFSLDGIRIHLGTDVVWHKSVTDLSSLGDGRRLLKQLEKELDAQGLQKRPVAKCEY